MDALAAPALFFLLSLFKPKPSEPPKPTHAQTVMFEMLDTWADHQEDGVIQIKGKLTMGIIGSMCAKVAPGGFLLVAGDRKALTRYFKDHGWEKIPFMFEGNLIFRKPQSWPRPMRQSA